MSTFDAPRFLWEVRTPLVEMQPKKPAIPELPEVKPEEHGCGVYFLLGGDLVKIGCTRGLLGRIADLRSSSATPVRLVGWLIACTSLERTFHEELSRWRAHGEWFRITPGIVALIQFLNTDQEFRGLCADTHERKGSKKRDDAIRAAIRLVTKQS